ncbi:Response regulator receiver domain-containing protein [Flavobacterium flevense]|uniref:Response regulator n=1 Tax=Flavobacterium flevense TaxID=983 RepID=A0A4Y4ATQ5_9FLAO|nr:response regulator [Flavobacterium flevense]GEC71601.1 response regulator [Flavobacterium flevense]SHL48970.1 Response regulator receiver domain-containing protein [Flavobacterium flevense]
MKTIRNMTLIDDDDIFVFLTKKAIQTTNLVELIKVFGNGLDAINFLKENCNNSDALPEIILLDLSMPIMDGWQFLDEFTKLAPKIDKKITIYICSSSISPSDVLLAKKNNLVSDYIIKPVSKEKLIELIKGLIDAI